MDGKWTRFGVGFMGGVVLVVGVIGGVVIGIGPKTDEL
jgi:hypothetical protein